MPDTQVRGWRTNTVLKNYARAPIYFDATSIDHFDEIALVSLLTLIYAKFYVAAHYIRILVEPLLLAFFSHPAMLFCKYGCEFLLNLEYKMLQRILKRIMFESKRVTEYPLLICCKKIKKSLCKSTSRRQINLKFCCSIFVPKYHLVSRTERNNFLKLSKRFSH